MESSQTTRIIWAIVAVIIIVILFFVLPGDSNKQDAEPTNVADIEVKQVDLENAGNDSDKLPKGFPSDIPLTSENVVESYSSEYKDRGYTQHTVAFDTRDTISSLHALYETYMIAAGYEVTASSVDSSVASVSGTLDNDDLTVIVTVSENTRRVTLNYLDRD